MNEFLLNNRVRIAAGSAAILVGVVIFTTTLIHALAYSPEKEIIAPPHAFIGGTASSTSQSDLPIELIIPSIGVDAHIQDVGISFKGNMSVPDNFTDVGWYKYGPMSGQKGSAVIDGHVDNGLAMSGVFTRLHELKTGDDVYVQIKSGQKLHFMVHNSETYYYTDAPLEKIFNQKDTGHLNLITCEGNWLRDARTDDHRLVVYTTLVQ